MPGSSTFQGWRSILAGSTLGFLGFLFGLLGGILLAVLCAIALFRGRGGTLRLTRWGSMIGGVEARTLEDDAHRLVKLAQRRCAAFRTTNQGFVVEMLPAIELDSAIVTPVGVQGHEGPPNQPSIIVSQPRPAKVAGCRALRAPVPMTSARGSMIEERGHTLEPSRLCIQYHTQR
jgi:hypothetical protein